MSACQDYEELLTLHATGALEPEDEARVRMHLERCAACRSEAESTASLLGQVALPALSAAEKEKLEGLPRQVTGAWRKAQVRKALRTRTVGALLATAAVLMLMLAPSILRHDGSRLLPDTPRAASTGSLSSTGSETAAEFEQWAAADPLSEMLEPGAVLLDEEGLDESWEEDGLESADSELFLNLNPGE
ncbi:MAG TPA: zf-HC2 domain-containing protein [Myxococcaceae bacterium]|jgi:anti-sigma factor RsiW